MSFLSLLLLLSPPSPADPAPEIVERAIAYHGGGTYEASTTTLTQSSASGSFELRVRRHDGRFEQEIRSSLDDGSTRRTVFTNTSIRDWREGVEIALDPGAQARVQRFVQARTWFPFLPYGLTGESVRHDDQGLEQWGERSLHRVKVTFAPTPEQSRPDEYLVWFDPESGQLEQYAYAYNLGTPRAGLRFRTASNFRRVGGLLFADFANYGDQGRAELTVDLITPEFAGALPLVSRVELSSIEVTTP